MIEIDDAGWGCLIGGVVLGCYRGERGEFAAGQIAPAYFQNDDPEQPGLYRSRVYLAQAAAVVAVCLQELGVGPTEPVRIGRGAGLAGVRGWLTAQGYRWQPAVCAGPLAGLVAHALQAHLAGLGFPVSYAQLTDRRQAGLFWYRQVEWLKGGQAAARQPAPARAAVCKTGWAAYTRWAYQPYAAARAGRAGANRRRGPW